MASLKPLLKKYNPKVIMIIVDATTNEMIAHL